MTLTLFSDVAAALRVTLGEKNSASLFSMITDVKSLEDCWLHFRAFGFKDSELVDGFEEDLISLCSVLRLYPDFKDEYRRNLTGFNKE